MPSLSDVDAAFRMYSGLMFANMKAQMKVKALELQVEKYAEVEERAAFQDNMTAFLMLYENRASLSACNNIFDIAFFTNSWCVVCYRKFIIFCHVIIMWTLLCGHVCVSWFVHVYMHCLQSILHHFKHF